MRIAAAADVHARASDAGEEERIRGLFAGVARDADALVLAGDLTDHGRASEAEVLLRALDGVGVPVIGVLGNHDHESRQAADLARMLRSGGLRLLDRDSTIVGDVGFAGVKGFAGGFEPLLIRGFGEDALKAFVAESVVEAEALRQALRALGDDVRARVAVLHYAPVRETLVGEPAELHPFLGTHRLALAIDEGRASLALHGHAHHGAPAGRTAGGVPVLNVSLPVLRAAGEKRAYVVIDV